MAGSAAVGFTGTDGHVADLKSIPTLLLFEKQPRWEAAIKAECQEWNVRVRPVRQISEVVTLSRATDCRLVLLHLPDDAGGCLRAIPQLKSQSPRLAVVCIVSKWFASLEWAARELGACQVIDEHASGAVVARFCVRQLGPLVRRNDAGDHARQLVEQGLRSGSWNVARS